jgi:hypothetical protein
MEDGGVLAIDWADVIAPDKAASSAPLPLLRPIMRRLTEPSIARIRTDFPGWDVYALKAEFDTWLDADAAREPTSPPGSPPSGYQDQRFGTSGTPYRVIRNKDSGYREHLAFSTT